MVKVIKDYEVLKDGMADCRRQHESDQVLVYERGGCIFAFNFHPTNSQTGLFINAREHGDYKVILSSDDKEFGGTGVDNGTIKTEELGMHGYEQCISLKIPALSVMFFEKLPDAPKKKKSESSGEKKETKKKTTSKKTTAKKSDSKKKSSKSTEKKATEKKASDKK
jgi:1,4-alpha-glucan branching enzyme